MKIIKWIIITGIRTSVILHLLTLCFAICSSAESVIESAITPEGLQVTSESNCAIVLKLNLEPIDPTAQYILKFEATIPRPGQPPLLIHNNRKPILQERLNGPINRLYCKLNREELSVDPTITPQTTTELGTLGGFIQSLEVRKITDSVEADSSQLNTVPSGSVQGVIVATSKIIDPQTSPYEDALVAVQIRLTADNREIIALIPAFTDRQLEPIADCRVGDRLALTLLSDNMVEAKTKNIQIIDDLENYELEQFYIGKVQKIADELPSGTTSATGNTPQEHEAEQPIVFPDGRSEMSKNLRQTAIAEDLAQVNAQIAAHGGLDQWYESLADYHQFILKPENFGLQKKVSEALFATARSKRDVEQCLTRRPFPGKVPSLDGALLLKNFLDERGIDLIVINLPNSYELSLDLFYDGAVPEDRIFSPARVQVQQQFLANDIEIIDPYAELLSERFHYSQMFRYNIQDRHVFWPANVVIARKLADRLSRYGFGPNREDPGLFSTKNVENDKTMMIQEVVYLGKNKNFDSFEFSNSASPIVYTGDSQSLDPSSGSSLRAYIAQEIGVVPCATQLIRGSGASKLRDFMKLPDDFWLNRQVCILMITGDALVVPWTVIDFKAMRKFQKGVRVFIQNTDSGFEQFSILPQRQNIPLQLSTNDGFAVSAAENCPVELLVNLPLEIEPGYDYTMKIEVTLPKLAAPAFNIIQGGQMLSRLRPQGSMTRIYCQLDADALQKNPGIKIQTNAEIGNIGGTIKSLEIRKTKRQEKGE